MISSSTSLGIFHLSEMLFSNQGSWVSSEYSLSYVAFSPPEVFTVNLFSNFSSISSVSLLLILLIYLITIPNVLFNNR